MAQGGAPDPASRVVHVYQLGLHHVELLQAVGVLRVRDVADVLKHLERVYGLALALVQHRHACLRDGGKMSPR
jgi:hypothetical protein